MVSIPDLCYLTYFISLEWKNIYFGGPYFIEIGVELNYGAVIVHDI